MILYSFNKAEKYCEFLSVGWKATFWNMFCNCEIVVLFHVGDYILSGWMCVGAEETLGGRLGKLGENEREVMGEGDVTLSSNGSSSFHSSSESICDMF